MRTRKPTTPSISEVTLALQSRSRLPISEDEVRQAQARVWQRLGQQTAQPVSERKVKRLPFPNHLPLAPVWLRLRPYALSVLCLAVVASSTIYYWRSNGRSPLTTERAVASGYHLEATRADSTGILPDSELVMTAEADVLSARFLRENLVVIPAVAYTVKEESGKRVIISFPKALTDDSIYRFALKTPEGGETIGWAFQVRSRFRVLQSLPRNHATGVPVSGGIEVTFSHQNYEPIDSYFEITPAVEGRFERHKRTTVFVPKSLQPQTVYSVTVKKGVKLIESDEALADDYTFTFETAPAGASYPPSVVEFSDSLNQSLPNERPVLPVQSGVSTEALRLDVYAIPTPEAFVAALQAKDARPLWSSYNRDGIIRDPEGLTKVLSFVPSVSSSGSTGPYIVFPQEMGNGYYLLDLWTGTTRRQALFQVCPTAAFVAPSETKLLVWAKDLTDGSPATGRELKLVGESASLGTTGSDGSLSVDLPTVLSDLEGVRYLSLAGGETPLILPVTADGERYDYRDYSYNLDASIRGSRSGHYWQYLTIDREKYQPTDSLRYWGLVQARDGRANSGYSLSLTGSVMTDSANDEYTILKRSLEPSSEGAYSGEVSLTNQLPGWYCLTLKRGTEEVASRCFTVERYSKPAYALDGSLSKKAIMAGDEIAFSGTASYFEGTKVPGLSLSYSGVGSGTVSTNSKGAFQILYRPPTEVAPNRRSSWEYAVVKPTQGELGEVTAEGSYQVFKTDVVLEKKEDRSTADTLEMDLAASHLDLSRLNAGTARDTSDYRGGAWENLPVKVVVAAFAQDKTQIGEYYDYLTKQTVPQYRVTDRFVGSTDVDVTTDATGIATVRTPRTAEYKYVLTIRTTDSAGRTPYSMEYVYPYQPESQSHADHDSYNLSVDGGRAPEGYSLGAKVSLTIRDEVRKVDAPERDGGYLFFQARSGIRSYQVSAAPKITVTFTEEYLPTLTVGAVYFDGRSFHTVYAEALPYKQTDRALEVKVQVDKAQYRPGDTVSLTITTPDGEGKGKAAEVNVKAIDAAYLAMGDSSESDDVLSGIYNRVSPGVAFMYGTHVLPSADGGGGGGCFTAGTPVLLTDGLTAPIEAITPGMQIATLTGDGANGVRVPATVSATYVHHVSGYLTVNGSLQLTPEHVLWTPQGWRTAGSLRVGDQLRRADGRLEAVVSVTSTVRPVTVYNLEIERYHTFIAGGRYVHNSKGDRVLFLDRATFQTVRTNAGGTATLTFTLPDNLTSWELTAHAVSADRYAGTARMTIPVKQPFFIDPVLANDFLVGDVPSVTLRALGDELREGARVEYTLTAPAIGLDGTKVEGAAFASVAVSIPKLTQAGSYSLKIAATVQGSNDLTDSVTLPITVRDSRLTRTEVQYQTVANGRIATPLAGSAVASFSDAATGMAYSTLVALAGQNGARVDQQLGAVLASEYLRDYYGEAASSPSFNADLYQTESGGISLMSYSDADPLLSAKVAELVPDRFDRRRLTDYLWSLVDNSSDNREQTVLGYWGLAALGEPVLPSLELLAAAGDLAPLERLALASGFVQTGMFAAAHTQIDAVLTGKETVGDALRITSGSDEDDSLAVTLLAAKVAASLQRAETPQLLAYSTRNTPKEFLPNFDLLAAVKAQLSQSGTAERSFRYTLDGKTETVTLAKGRRLSLQLTPEQQAAIRFDGADGSVGITLATQVPVAQAGGESGLSVSRRYLVNGKPTAEFPSTGLVRVELAYQTGAQVPAGCLAVTDVLPAGLRLASPLYVAGVDSQGVSYPYAQDGQKVSFCGSRDASEKTIAYYARVVSAGEYTAEAPLIQVAQGASLYALGQATVVRVK